MHSRRIYASHLDGYGLRGKLPARPVRWRLVSGFCPSTRTFVPCFLQTPPRGGSPCIITRPSPPSGRPEDFHLQAAEHAQHTTKPLARRMLSACSRFSDVGDKFMGHKEFIVTHLRKLMLEELQRRNYSPKHRSMRMSTRWRIRRDTSTVRPISSGQNIFASTSFTCSR